MNPRLRRLAAMLSISMLATVPAFAKMPTSGTITPANADATLAGAAGGVVAPLGDFDGDGIDDFGVGGTSGLRIVYGGPTRHGTTSLDAATGARITGTMTEFTASDLNRDGRSDLIIGAHGNDFSTNAGRVFVFYGRSPRLTGVLGTANADATLVGTAGDAAGRRVAGRGDLDGDGFGDALIGAPRVPGAPGEAYVLYGRASRLTGTLSLVTTATRIAGAQGDTLGSEVAIGDADGDGHADALIGATGSARIYAFYGGTRLANTSSTNASWTIVDDICPLVQSIGFEIVVAGDMNGDGVNEIALGAPNYGDGSPTGQPCGFSSNSQGATYLMYGASVRRTGQTPLSAAEAFLIGNTLDSSGAPTASAGDLNGDGRGDVLISTPNALDPETGTPRSHVSVFFGRPALSGRILLSSVATTITARAGESVGFGLSGIGDVNGDGSDDMAITTSGAFAGVALWYGWR